MDGVIKAIRNTTAMSSQRRNRRCPADIRRQSRRYAIVVATAISITSILPSFVVALTGEAVAATQSISSRGKSPRRRLRKQLESDTVVTPPFKEFAQRRSIDVDIDTEDEDLARLFDELIFDHAMERQTDDVSTVSSSTEQCPSPELVSNAMYNADVDSNGFLDRTEYYNFVNMISNEFLSDAGYNSFSDMPLSLRETYLVLSCLCELYPAGLDNNNNNVDNPNNNAAVSKLTVRSGCCTASDGEVGIRTNGTGPEDDPGPDVMLYLRYVCEEMNEALITVGAEMSAGEPTGTPTSGVPTIRPTMAAVKPSPTTTKKPSIVDGGTTIATGAPDGSTTTTTGAPTGGGTGAPDGSTTITEPPSLDGGSITGAPDGSGGASKSPSSSVTGAPDGSTTGAPAVGRDPDTNPPTYIDSNGEVVIGDGASKSPSSAVTGAPDGSTTGAPDGSTTGAPAVVGGGVNGSDTNPPTYIDSNGEVVIGGGASKSPSSAVTGAPDGSTTGAPVMGGGDGSDTNPPTYIGSNGEVVIGSKSPSSSVTGNPDGSTSIPTSSFVPTYPPEPSAAPSFTPYPTTSAAPSYPPNRVDEPAKLSFIASVNGEVNARDVLKGETNQVKAMLEMELLELCEEVVGEEFGTGLDTGNDVTSISREFEPSIRRRMTVMERMLVVEKCMSATIDNVTDVDCPGGTSSTAIPCLNFTTTTLLHMVNETNPEEKIQAFIGAALGKISGGWLADNFDLEDALKPPPPPTYAPTTVDFQNEVARRKRLPGILIGVIAAFFGLCCCGYCFFTRRRNSQRTAEDNAAYVENQQPTKEDGLAGDGFDDRSLYPDTSNSSVTTDDKSYSSQDALLAGQRSSTDMNPVLPVVAEGREIGMSIDDTDQDSVISYDGVGFQTASAGSALAAMGAAGTAAAMMSTSRSYSPTASMDGYSNMDPDLGSGSMSTDSGAAGLSSTGSHIGTVDAIESSAIGGAGGGSGVSGGKGGSGDGGMGIGTAATIGAAGAGVLAVGAYAATRRGNGSDKSGEERSISNKDSTESSSNPMDDLDGAIEAGNWGQVGALAAVLASKGQIDGRPKKASRSASVAETSHDSSGSKANSLDKTRALEIDRLVEAGDWQGVVLAAARFEADQTFDGESYSHSASVDSSRWTGSNSSAISRSMATTDPDGSGSSSNQRGQEEIRAEIEALVKRVVPEEKDNIDEMLSQFKGREEELVETLRRMQERAIASRARLAVQKSAKLEARIKAGPRGVGTGIASSGGSSVASATSSKSELEAAIEAGNWQAVGAAAQKMSDSSVGDLSTDEIARIRTAISQSQAFARRRPTDDDLDQLIEDGDWQGVIAAAKRATEGPDLGEQDALAQADMWQGIADQSKVEARQGPAGAGDATVWAIQRSLKNLNPSPGRTIENIADEENSEASQYESSSYGGDSAGRSENYRRGI